MRLQPTLTRELCRWSWLNHVSARFRPVTIRMVGQLGHMLDPDASGSDSQILQPPLIPGQSGGR